MALRRTLHTPGMALLAAAKAALYAAVCFDFFPGLLALTIWTIATSVASYRTVALPTRELVATAADS